MIVGQAPAAESNVHVQTTAAAPSSTTTTAAPVRPCAGYPPHTPPKVYARLYGACRYHWDAHEFACEDWIFTRESHWNPTAHRAAGVHGSYGIPQANPGTRMASAGPDWRTNPRTQIRWASSYIAGRYGTPCRAKQFWRSHGWY